MPKRTDILKIRFLGSAFAGTTLFLGFPTMQCAQTVIAPWQVPCSVEKVEPNLALKMKTHVTGNVKDQSGAPFVRSKILLRRISETGKTSGFKEVFTDGEGNYDLGLVSPGRYRFLPSPGRGFSQPKRVDCFERESCELKVVLQGNPTDQEFVNCPIQ